MPQMQETPAPRGGRVVGNAGTGGNGGRHAPTRAEIAPQGQDSAPLLSPAAAYHGGSVHHHHQAATATAQEQQYWEEEETEAEFAQEEYAEAEESHQHSLLHRMKSKLAAAAPAMRMEEDRPRQRRVEIARENPQPAHDSGHDIEIPAFLRRQAN